MLWFLLSLAENSGAKLGSWYRLAVFVFSCACLLSISEGFGGLILEGP
jgi:hypothetical protein